MQFRYTLAYLKDGQFNTLMTFVDIYTHTSYSLVDNTYVTKVPVVVNAKSLIINCEYLTEKEALHILKELNPTYLKEEKTKKLRLFK